jgi:N utilization substance protein B
MSPKPDLGPNSRRTAGHRRRRTARRLAVDILYQADVTGRAPRLVADDWRAAGRSVAPYTEELVGGVEDEQGSIDALLGSSADEWTVARMVAVDRTILRVACYEMLSGVPPAIAINEALEAANELSTEDSARFVNGVLGKIARDLQADRSN